MPAASKDWKAVNPAKGILAASSKEIFPGFFEIGDLVYSRVPQEQMGTLTEYVAVDSAAVSKKPGNISFSKTIPLTS